MLETVIHWNPPPGVIHFITMGACTSSAKNFILMQYVVRSCTCILCHIPKCMDRLNRLHFPGKLFSYTCRSQMMCGNTKKWPMSKRQVGHWYSHHILTSSVIINSNTHSRIKSICLTCIQIKVLSISTYDRWKAAANLLTYCKYYFP